MTSLSRYKDPLFRHSTDLLGAAENQGHFTLQQSRDIGVNTALLELIRRSEGEEIRPTEQRRIFRNLGEQLQAIVRIGHGFGVDPRLDQVHERALGLGEKVGSDGGFLVSAEDSAAILYRSYLTSEFLNRATLIPITQTDRNSLSISAPDETSRVNGLRWGGITTYWSDEAETITASKPKVRQVNMKPKKLTGLVYVTDELLSDAQLLSEFMLIAFSDELRFVTERACMFGVGAGQPLGYVNSGSALVVAKEVGQSAGSVVSQNIVNLWARNWGAGRSKGVWFCNPELEPQFIPLAVPVGTGGGPLQLYRPAEDDSQPYGRMLGRPVVPAEWCAAVGSQGDLIFCDPSQYLITDRGGIRSAFSMHVNFLTDQSCFRFTYRVDGQPMWGSPVTPLNGSNTVSPCTVLAARA